MKVKIRKLDEKAVVPSYQHPGEDACFDLSVIIDDKRNCPKTVVCEELVPLMAVTDSMHNETAVLIQPHQTVVFGTGLAAEIEKGYMMRIHVRSSVGIKRHLMLANGTGIIDSNYRGEIMIALTNTSDIEGIIVDTHERVAQAEICKVENVEFEVVDELSETTRGEGGIGSTGKN